MKRLVPITTLLAIAASLLPLVYLLLVASAGPWTPPDVLPASLTLHRFGDLLAGEGALLESLGLSVAIGLAVATLSTGLGFVTSRAIAESRFRTSWIGLAYLPFAISPVILAVCMLFFFLRAGLAGTVIGVALSHLPLAYGFAIVLLLGAWNPEKRALADVARTLGARPATVWLKVLVPAAAPLLRVCFFQTFLISWVQYGLTLMIGQGSVRTLPLRVFDYVNEADPAYAAVAGLLLIAPPLILLWFERRMVLKAV
ncbi:MAG: hypothetical protein AAF658_09550 [Myxococcota bacterium]